MSDINEIRMQVMWNRLISVVEEQALTLLRTAFSTSVREAGDLSAGVYNAKGEMLAQAVTGTPGHVNTMAEAVLHFIAEIPREEMYPGDTYVTNDPWKGTGHLHDITMVSPSFKGEELIGFFACTAHVVDVGGRGFGADGKSVYEEGIQIPIMKFAERGTVNKDLLKILRLNVREPNQVIGDFYSLAACNDVGHKRLIEMLEEVGYDNLDTLGDFILSRTHAATMGFVNPTSFTFFESALILAIVVLGGLGSTVGVIAAALVLTILPELLRDFAEYRVLIFGVLMVVMMIWKPRGLVRIQRPAFFPSTAPRGSDNRPDGYTILMSSVTSTTLTSLMQETAMGFDYQNDFVPVAVVGEILTVLVVNKDFPAQTANELIAAAKEGAKISYASTGVGSVEHLAMELFQQLTKAELLHVPYDGAASGIADVAGGHVAAMIATVPTALPQIEGGTVRSLLVASDKRLDKLPDTATASEVGLDGLNVASMYAVLAPKDVDKKILEQLNAALAEITSDEKYRTTMAERGIESNTTSLEEANARFSSEFDKWKRVVETINVAAK